MNQLPPHVHVFDTRAAMGAAAASDVADELRARLNAQERVRMVFAAAPSQAEMLDALVAAEGIDWSRVDAFHMDEYLGLPEGAPERHCTMQHAARSKSHRTGRTAGRTDPGGN